jgi:hypothetical protein
LDIIKVTEAKEKMKIVKQLFIIIFVCSYIFLIGCNRNGTSNSDFTNFYNSRNFTQRDNAINSSASILASSSNSSSNVSSSQVFSSNSNNIINSHKSGVSKLNVKITPENAQKIACLSAKEARKTVAYWKDASVSLTKTDLISHTPNYVYPINEISNPHYQYEKQINLETPMYEVTFTDINQACSFLLIYINAKTGELIGGKYEGE